MKFHAFRRGAALMLLAAAFTAFTGCANSSSQGTRSTDGSSYENQVYSPKIPENKVDENLPGEEQNTDVGQTLQYQDKVSATLSKVIEFDKCAEQDMRFFVAEFSITNQSSEPLDCSSLTHFSLKRDGEKAEDDLNNVSALVFSRKYYTKIKSDMKILNQAIEPGQTLTGYIYMITPKKWDSLQIIYTPYKYYNTDKLIFDVSEASLTHYAEEIS